MNKVIVITGPTAVGKTKLSIELAKRYNGEIINADAVQVYKGLDIGSAKVTEEEKEGIPHHLFDIKEVDEELYNKLLEVDKDIVIDKNNRRRLIRALNYYKENNKSINTNTTNKLLYDAIFIGLTTDRRILYDKINNRVDIMIKDGLLNEVKAFYDKNIRTKPLLNAIGYREIYSYFDGNISLEEAINKIKQNSRHYAKRQYTFFNHQLPIVWFETDYSNFNNTIEQIISYIENN